MTLKRWSASASHHRNIPSTLVVEPNPSVLRPSTGTVGPITSSSGRSLEPRNMGRGRATPKSNRCRSQSSNWDKDAVEHSGESGDDDGLHSLDATASTLPTPSHQIHAIPALWVSSRRRHHRGRSRRRSTSEMCGNLSRASSGFRSHHIYHDRSSSLLSEEQEQLREATTATATATAAAAGRPLNQRLRITMPDSPPFSGWVRGQAADVQWEALDPSVQCVRIDVCNVAWTVPTTIAHRVGNDGTFHWRRVYWGMPIAEGYYVNIYDVTEQKDPSDSMLLAQSERFAVIK